MVDSEPTGIQFPKIPEIGDVLVGELAEAGNWVVANVQTNGYWPVASQKVPFRGANVWVLPITNRHFPAVAIKVGRREDNLAAVKILNRFLSALSWVEGYGYMVDSISGGSRPMPMGREKTMGFSVSDGFDLSYFPELADERALLGLALMREGRGLNHPAYAFLSYYRVLEVAFPNGRARGRWMDAKVDLLNDPRAKDAIKALRASGVQDVGTHLQKTNRQAIAHAGHGPIIDPDDPSDGRRLLAEMPIIQKLAELAIEQVLGVETPLTVYQKHLYELAGFKEIFGAELVERIKSDDQSELPPVDIPPLDIRIRTQEPYPPLRGMIPTNLEREGSTVNVFLRSADGRGMMALGLDFAQERLLFEIFEDIRYSDDGTSAAAEAIAEVKRFFSDYIGNGQLHIYNPETGVLLSRKDAYLPVNIMPDWEGAKREIARWRAIAEVRGKRSASVENEIIQLVPPYILSIAVNFGEVPIDL